MNDDREDVAGRQDQQVLARVLDLGSAVLGVDDLVTHGNALRLCSFIMAIRSFNIGWLRQWQAMGATGWTNCAFSSALA